MSSHLLHRLLHTLSPALKVKCTPRKEIVVLGCTPGREPGWLRSAPVGYYAPDGRLTMPVASAAVHAKTLGRNPQ